MPSKFLAPRSLSFVLRRRHRNSKAGFRASKNAAPAWLRLASKMPLLHCGLRITHLLHAVFAARRSISCGMCCQSCSVCLSPLDSIYLCTVEDIIAESVGVLFAVITVIRRRLLPTFTSPTSSAYVISALGPDLNHLPR
jgi:hypothetical protein